MHITTEPFDEAFSNVTLDLYSNAQQVCLSYSLRALYSGCSMVYLQCTTESLWNYEISVQYMSAHEQTMCINVGNGSYSFAVFGVNRNGLLDTTPALTKIKKIGNYLTHKISQEILIIVISDLFIRIYIHRGIS